MFAILQRAHYLSGTYGVIEGWTLHSEGYASRAAARARIAQMEEGVYYLAHGEHGRPDYQVTRVGSRRYVAARRRWDPGLEWNPGDCDLEEE